jgi:cytochrome c556
MGEAMEKEHLEIILENIDKKFDIVIEGYSTLDRKIDDLAQKTTERFDLVDFKIDTLNQKIDAVDERLSNKIDAVEEKLTNKIDAVESKLGNKIDSAAADLKAHRQDTEAHHGMYRVKES